MSEYFTVECRGIKIKVPIKYLERIDLFRTQNELTGSKEFILDDFSDYTFNKYIDYLQHLQHPKFKDIKISDDIKLIYDYLNTNCEKKSDEKNKEITKKKCLDYMKTAVFDKGILEKTNCIEFPINQLYFLDVVDEFKKHKISSIFHNIFLVKCVKNNVHVFITKNTFNMSKLNVFLEKCKYHN